MNLFNTDGLPYKIATVIYNMLILNILWVLFSIPFITIGASTTALFYVTGKLIRGETVTSIIKPFWHSFKSNFKQATIIWLILFFFFSIIYTNIVNIEFMGNLRSLFGPIQLVLLLEGVIVSIYIFPLLARHHIGTVDAFKASFYIGNRHILTTIPCLAVFPGIYYLLMWRGYFIFFVMSIYSFWISYLIRGKFARYAGIEKEEEDTENESESDITNKID
ncbi:MAG: YesL family protein [Halanaerobiales bacterium]